MVKEMNDSVDPQSEVNTAGESENSQDPQPAEDIAAGEGPPEASKPSEAKNQACEDQPRGIIGQDDPKTDETLKADKQQQQGPPKKSAGEAFAELRDEIESMQGQLEDIRGYTEKVKDFVSQEIPKNRLKAMEPALESLYGLYDILFSRIQAMESGLEKPDGFTVNFLENMKGELLRHNIQVIQPQPGEPLNLEVMTLLGAEKCAWWRTPDTVARLHQCGFVYDPEGPRLLLRKAVVDIYRKL